MGQQKLGEGIQDNVAAMVKAEAESWRKDKNACDSNKEQSYTPIPSEGEGLFTQRWGRPFSSFTWSSLDPE